MARLVSIIIGLVLFSLFVTFMFKVGADLSTNAGSSNSATFTTLSNNYDRLDNYSLDKNTTIRRIKDSLDYGFVKTGLYFVEEGLTGGKILMDSVDNTGEIVDQVGRDSPYAAELGVFSIAIKAILSVIFIIAMLYFVWRAKAET